MDPENFSFLLIEDNVASKINLFLFSSNGPPWISHAEKYIEDLSVLTVDNIQHKGAR